MNPYFLTTIFTLLVLEVIAKKKLTGLRFVFFLVRAMRNYRKSRPKGRSASGMSFRCWSANGMPMMVMARMSAEPA